MRLLDWMEQLDARVEAARFRPRVYGQTDCCQFAGEVVLALTGVDHRPAFGAYATEEEAQAIIDSHGGLVAMISSVLGDHKPVARAKRGDVLACYVDGGAYVAICLGVMCCAPGPDGLLFFPAQSGICSWSVA